MFQKTIAKPVEVVGIGLHKGESVRLKLEPMDPDSGIIFYRSDIHFSIPLTPDFVIDTKMATVIGDPKKGFISTIEHFLSVLYAFGIDNLRVIVDGNEMPIMDGSGISFVLLLKEAGLKSQNVPKKILKVKKAVEVRDGKKFARLEPLDGAIFDFEIDFPHPVIGRERFIFDFKKHSYTEEIARARTFGFIRDIQYLQSQNLALGASLKNAIGLDEHRVLNPEGLRYKDEFVRHKILDAMGDMKLLGYTIVGRYRSFAGSHALNHLLTKELLASKANYEIISLSEKLNTKYERAFARV
jgi:UDP-3-O-[3-hydroxymyristoyl] N-acetylglucosamine deacetylase